MQHFTVNGFNQSTLRRPGPWINIQQQDLKPSFNFKDVDVELTVIPVLLLGINVSTFFACRWFDLEIHDVHNTDFFRKIHITNCAYS